MPIVVAPLERDLKIIKILCDEKTKKHLESLGIIVNSFINILSQANGSVIIKFKSGRLALDKSVATRIFVA